MRSPAASFARIVLYIFRFESKISFPGEDHDAVTLVERRGDEYGLFPGLPLLERYVDKLHAPAPVHHRQFIRSVNQQVPAGSHDRDPILRRVIYPLRRQHMAAGRHRQRALAFFVLGVHLS